MKIAGKKGIYSVGVTGSPYGLESGEFQLGHLKDLAHLSQLVGSLDHEAVPMIDQELYSEATGERLSFCFDPTVTTRTSRSLFFCTLPSTLGVFSRASSI